MSVSADAGSPTGGERSSGLQKRVGVVGTLVWDTIHQRDGRPEPAHEWGGIAYALAAMSASIPDGWQVVPLIKVGRDLGESALRFLRGLPRVELDTGVRIVQEPNNRVELRYLDRERRTEHLSGGVPPWSWPELSPLARSCDALYVNFISGFEATLPTMRELRAHFTGPMHGDLHSLFLGLEDDGTRVPQPLSEVESWTGCFEVVQFNEAEFASVRDGRDADAVEEAVLRGRPEVLLVTLGSRGCRYAADRQGRWIAAADRFSEPATHGSVAPVVRGTVQGDIVAGMVDPTGCGDVWGATAFARMLMGSELQAALGAANRAAAISAAGRGTRDLANRLRSDSDGATSRGSGGEE